MAILGKNNEVLVSVYSSNNVGILNLTAPLGLNCLLPQNPPTLVSIRDHPDSLCTTCLASRLFYPCVNLNPSILTLDRLTVRVGYRIPNGYHGPTSQKTDASFPFPSCQNIYVRL